MRTRDGSPPGTRDAIAAEILDDDATGRIVQKLWSYCNVLRDDGLSYQDYLEQLTFLLFIKMADERAAMLSKDQPIPKGYRWSDLANPQMEGDRLEIHYRKTLETLGKQGGMLGIIYRKSQNKIQDPAKLRRLIVDLIGTESWLVMSADGPHSGPAGHRSASPRCDCWPSGVDRHRRARAGAVRHMHGLYACSGRDCEFGRTIEPFPDTPIGSRLCGRSASVKN